MVGLNNRQPAVAGMFYPATRDALVKSIHSCFMSPIGPGRYPTVASRSGERVECLIVPHAGYMYSGPIAAHAFENAFDFLNSESNEKINVLMAGPNHHGIGIGVALSPAESWITPLGEMPVRANLSRKFTTLCDIVDFDEVAHEREHSLEVQLPFIQDISKGGADVGIVPISLILQDFETAKQLANALYRLIIDTKDERFLVLGSSDLTHYEKQDIATRKDLTLLEAVTSCDLSRFYEILENLSVTACGYGAMAVVMEVAKKLSKKKGTLLKYATSGDVSGDKSSVVGYSAVRFA